MATRDPLRIWRLLNEATLAGHVTWRRHRTDLDLFEARVAGKHAHVKFLRFDRADGSMPDRAALEVVALDTQADDFAVGTEGFEIIASMIAACDPDWSEARERGEKFRSEAEKLSRSSSDESQRRSHVQRGESPLLAKKAEQTGAQWRRILVTQCGTRTFAPASTEAMINAESSEYDGMPLRWSTHSPFARFSASTSGTSLKSRCACISGRDHSLRWQPSVAAAWPSNPA